MEALQAKVADAPFDDPEADFILLTSDGVAFHVHSLLLSLVSPVFSGMSKLPEGGQKELFNGKPFASLSDSAASLHLLLSWCDPRCSRSSNIDDLHVVLQMADKYSIDNVIKLVTASILAMKNEIAAHPLRVFAVAARFKLDELAKVAAHEAIKKPLFLWPACSELKLIPASTYRSLHMFQERCRIAALQAVYFAETLPAWEIDAFYLHCEDADCTIEDEEERWKGWYAKFRKHALAVLKDRPVGDSLLSPETLNEIHAILSSITCESCRENAPANLHALLKDMVADVDRRIALVELHIDY